MTFDTLETSVEDGRPIYLYRFVLGATTWRYTAADTDILTVDGFLWKATAISDDGSKQSGEAITDALSIVCPIELGPVQLYMQMPPSTPMKAYVLRKDEANNTVNTVYAGEVSQINFPTPGTAQITCETLSASMKRTGLRLGWQKGCPYALYDPLTCRVPKAAHAVDGIILTAKNGVCTIDTTDPMANGYFSGGFIEWSHPIRGYESRFVEAQSAKTLTIFGTTDDIYPGTVIKLYPGCDLTAATCQWKFNNYDNYGGVPYLPGKSPFDGSPVF